MREKNEYVFDIDLFRKYKTKSPFIKKKLHYRFNRTKMMKMIRCTPRLKPSEFTRHFYYLSKKKHVFDQQTNNNTLTHIFLFI